MTLVPWTRHYNWHFATRIAVHHETAMRIWMEPVFFELMQALAQIGYECSLPVIRCGHIERCALLLPVRYELVQRPGL